MSSFAYFKTSISSSCYWSTLFLSLFFKGKGCYFPLAVPDTHKLINHTFEKLSQEGEHLLFCSHTAGEEYCGELNISPLGVNLEALKQL